ncbi:MAG: hemolysin family protein [Desulfobacteraceae bacterium]|nr:hemolysin family protein [Desulfobacteraceae bacterium]
MIQLIVAASLAIVISAMCSVLEAALYSVPASHIEVLSRAGRLSGRLLKNLKRDIHRPITAILTLNTVATTMGAAITGALAAGLLGKQYLGLFSGLFTLAILIFSEILPKTVGVAYSRSIALVMAVPLDWLVKILAPLVWAVRAITRLIPTRDEELLVSAEEIQATVALSRASGRIDLQQEKIISNILALREKTVRQAMTPRTVTFSLDEHLTVAEATELKVQWRLYSRVPVYDTDPDDVVGIVLGKDVLLEASEGHGEKRLTEIMHPVHFVPESAPLNNVLLDFIEKRSHLFVVVDEYGSVTGVISLEDIFEEIMGQEIMDESDQTRDMRELARLKRKTLTGR